MTESEKTYYEILGLGPDCSTAEIKRTFRRLAKAAHPDLEYQNKTEYERQKATEDMLRINEAYETLRDNRRRREYDVLIGITISIKQFEIKENNEDEARQIFLAKIFNPSRQSIQKIIMAYDKQIKDLAQDPFDDELVEAFGVYLADFEKILRKASNGLSSRPVPVTLSAAVHMMRLAIAQAVDALEEMTRFTQNYDYDHLSMAESLLRVTFDLLKQANALTRNY